MLRTDVGGRTAPAPPVGRDDATPSLDVAAARHPFGLLVPATTALFAGVLLVTVLDSRSATAQTVGDLGILASAVLALVGATRAARRGGPSARGWVGVAVAVLVWSLAQSVWTAYGLLNGHVYPFPSVADLGFVGYALPLAWGLALFPRSVDRSLAGWRIALDAAVAAAAVLFVSWATVLGPLAQSAGTGLARVAALAYPIADVTVASLVLVLGARAAAGTRRPWLFLGAGLLILAVTDSAYVTLVARGETALTGTPLAGGWMLAFLLVAMASQQGDRPGGRSRHFTLVQELLPLLPVGAALVVSAYRPVTRDPVLLSTGLVLLSALVVQQVLSAAEKVRLANALQDEAAQRTRELTDVESRFRFLVQSSDEAILSKSLQGIVTSWNPAAELLYGWSAEEMIGRSVGVLVPPERAAEERDLVARAGRGEQLRGIESVRVRKDGVAIPVALTVSPIFEDGSVTGVSVIGHDISLRRAQEEELAQAHAHAVAASHAKSEFLATMSHEIRTPMNGVIGLTGLLLRTELDATQRRYTEGVRGAGEALLAIIDDILNFSKLESGRVELEDVPFDPAALIEEVGVLMAPAASHKGLELLAYASPGVPAALRGDPGRVRQVLVNLVGNAIKFTSAGEVVLAARFTGGGGEREGLELRVSDTGVGLAAGDRERLFEPFSQADASTTRRYGGTGLGLAICRRLVSAMDGSLTLESELGAGSTFTVSLPLTRCQEPVAGPVTHRSVLGMRALIVDDNETNRLVLHEQLTAWRVDCELAESASVAWAAMQAAAEADQPFDVVVLDLCMPGVDGLELARRMSADPVLSRTRRLLLTSAGPVDPSELATAGVAACVTKPVRASALHDALLTTAFSSPAAEHVEQATVVSAALPRESRGRVLVVEDNAVNRLVAEGVLSSLGYDVDLAEDGEQALAVLSAQAYQAVLMDCHMPVMDGYDATLALRRREPAGRRLPVIAMTAGVLPEDRERCRQAGMDDFVAKPVDVDVLRETLGRWIPAAVGAAAPGAAPVPDGVLDQARLQLLRTMGPADGRGLLPAVIDAFVAGDERRDHDLQLAWQSGDPARLAAVLHGVRGTASNLGLTAVAAVCGELEQRSRGGGVLPDEALTRLRQEIRIGTLALTELLAQSG